MARRIPYIPNRVIDTNGISDGATIDVFETGTTTRVSIYSDEALTTPLSNPYTVSAGAAVPEIYHGETDAIRVRVTQDDGTVVSDDDPFTAPVTDADLSSTDSAKGVDLVAGAGKTIATRTAMKALTSAADKARPLRLVESGREGEFVWRAGDFSAEVAADTADGVYIKADDTAATAGAWVRQYDGAVWLHWFGAVEGDASGANAAANDAAWLAALSYLKQQRHNATAQWAGLGELRVGPGTYEFSQTIEITDGAINFVGSGSGHGGQFVVAGTTRLKFYGCTGFIIQDRDTSGTNTKDATFHNGGTYSTFRDFALEGDFDGTNEAEEHGFHVRAASYFHNINIRNFSGDGFHIIADSSTVGGNATHWRAYNCQVWNCRDGVYTFGNNAGAGIFLGGPLLNNRRWGINNEESVGSTWTAHMGQNGATSANDGVVLGASMVVHSGNLYGAISGQEAGASTNAPSGTTANNAWWYYISAGTVKAGQPAWFSGMTVRAGGPIRDISLTSRNAYLGCYAENSAQARAQIYQNSLIVGGYLADTNYQNPNPNKGVGVVRGDTDGFVTAEPSLQARSGDVVSRLGSNRGNTSNYWLYGSHPTVSPSGHTFQFNSTENAIYLTYGGSGAASVYSMYISGPNTTQTFGRSAPVPHATFFPRLMVGDDTANRALARQMMIDDAAPTTGNYARGDVVFNRNAGVGQPMGWMCTSTGSPGTWTAMPNL